MWNEHLACFLPMWQLIFWDLAPPAAVSVRSVNATKHLHQWIVFKTALITALNMLAHECHLVQPGHRSGISRWLEPLPDQYFSLQDVHASTFAHLLSVFRFCIGLDSSVSRHLLAVILCDFYPLLETKIHMSA